MRGCSPLVTIRPPAFSLADRCRFFRQAARQARVIHMTGSRGGRGTGVRNVERDKSGERFTTVPRSSVACSENWIVKGCRHRCSRARLLGYGRRAGGCDGGLPAGMDHGSDGYPGVVSRLAALAWPGLAGTGLWATDSALHDGSQPSQAPVCLRVNLRPVELLTGSEMQGWSLVRLAGGCEATQMETSRSDLWRWGKRAAAPHEAGDRFSADGVQPASGIEPGKYGKQGSRLEVVHAAERGPSVQYKYEFKYHDWHWQ
ncbi:hypothetical protein GGR56DRAFT_184996 [Xylariaceae sp. FL0804]|nr:hypothetical protein GGR56DRAFT_184996 [Xylariaceae sp. FL0804]